MLAADVQVGRVVLAGVHKADRVPTHYASVLVCGQGYVDDLDKVPLGRIAITDTYAENLGIVIGNQLYGVYQGLLPVWSFFQVMQGTLRVGTAFRTIPIVSTATGALSQATHCASVDVSIFVHKD